MAGKKKRSKGKSQRQRNRSFISARSTPPRLPVSSEQDIVSKLESLPITYQQVNDFFSQFKRATPLLLRLETYRRIEAITGSPLICYVSQTHHPNVAVPTFIDDSDVYAFGDLVRAATGDSVDVFLISNGGSAESTERIVTLLRDRFKRIRFLIPANAYSAATLMCLSGDQIVMDEIGTLGPIDPQINGVPTRAVLRGMESIEQRLKEEGPRALTAYYPLLDKYDLHMLEMCKSAEDLSKELATNWISAYMLRCDKTDARVGKAVKFLTDYDRRKSHSRSINRDQAKELGLEIVDSESIDGLSDLIRSLFNQFELWFTKTNFYKAYEDGRGNNWGRQAIPAAIPIQAPVIPRPGTPPPQGEPSSTSAVLT